MIASQEQAADSANPTSGDVELLEVRVRGRNTLVPSIRLEGHVITAPGRMLRVAQLFDEDLVEDLDFAAFGEIAAALRTCALPADIFTFAITPGHDDPQFDFPCEWDNVAAVDTTCADTWWSELPQESRKNARLAAKRGVVVRSVTFDDNLIRGIKNLYDEAPVRQGRSFWHYGKDLDSVRIMNETYIDRSQFVGAFLGEDLIGFVKYVLVDRTAVIMQILAMNAHRDKRPMNAMLKHIVDQCASRNIEYLFYGKFDYGLDRDSSLKEFKRRNGFVEVRFRRYFVPLTLRGRAAIALGLHKGVRHLIPAPIMAFLRKSRTQMLRHV